jgi:hypothetical protein
MASVSLNKPMLRNISFLALAAIAFLCIPDFVGAVSPVNLRINTSHGLDKPIQESADSLKMRAKELFSAGLLMGEGEDLLFNQKEYRAAEAKGYKALEI